MRIYYFNDRVAPVFVRIIGDRPEEIGSQDELLQPATGKTYEISCPPDSIPYVKVWENNTILLSFLSPSVLEVLQETDGALDEQQEDSSDT